MMIKRIEDWSYYELLNVERTASQEEIRKAYHAAVDTYSPGSLAIYNLVREEERVRILERIEEAYGILRDPALKKSYDIALLSHSPDFSPKVPFRQSVQKIEIEEVPHRKGFLVRILKLLTWK